MSRHHTGYSVPLLVIVWITHRGDQADMTLTRLVTRGDQADVMTWQSFLGFMNCAGYA